MISEITPCITVLMATYNRSSVLEQTINNIYEQDYRHLELIVVNDGSTDDTLFVLTKLREQYDFILINNKSNIGLQKSLNRGISRATGKYIARIDDHDTWIAKDKLSQQVAFLESNPEFGLVGTGYKVGEKIMRNPMTDTEIRNQILMRCPFCHVTVLMRKSILEDVGGYDGHLPYSEDWDLWLKMGRGSQFANLPQIMVEVKEVEHSLSGNFFLKQLSLNRELVQRYFQDYPRSLHAQFYHSFLQIFFTLIPLNSVFHRGMKRIFSLSFLS